MKCKCCLLLAALCMLLSLDRLNSFSPVVSRRRNHPTYLKAQGAPEQYKNKLVEYIGSMVQPRVDSVKDREQGNISRGTSSLSSIDWNKKKRKKTSLAVLAKDLEKALTEKEWFVTGNIDPSFFSEDFRFEDPDVKVTGIKSYAEGVNKIFNQDISKVDIINVAVNSSIANGLTVTWRLEGGVNIAFGLKIKPYIVYTDFVVNEKDGLIISQLDRFSIPGYDIVLSALFPFLIPFLSAPASPVTRK